MPTKERTRISDLCFQVLLRPNLPGRFGDFFPGPLACLKGWLEAQLLTQVCNCIQTKSWSRIPVNCGRAVPRPSLADSARESLSLAAEATVSPSLDSTGKECLATNLSFQGLSLAEPKWVSGKFKLMSGPVMSWQEQGARLDPRPTSNTSQQVLCNASVGFRGYIPCINHRYHHGMHAGSIVV